jgi:RNA-directed DNA polymerase
VTSLAIALVVLLVGLLYAFGLFRRRTPRRRREKIAEPLSRRDARIVVDLAPRRAARREPMPGSLLRPQATGDAARVKQRGLPVLPDTDAVLRWLKLDIKSLVALANPAARVTRHGNYFEYSRPKKSGGVRIICAPKRRITAVQRFILHELLDRVPLPSAVHGFVRDRDIFSNASRHLNRQVVLNADLRDFFGHITYPRVVGLFHYLGYSSEVSRWLGLLCTHRPRLDIAQPDPHDPTHSQICGARRHAVQGAPTSPMIANLVAGALDRRLTGLAAKFDAVYTRYADDMTFSGDERFKRGLKRFLPLLRKIVREEGFRQHPKKQRMMRSGRRQEVTGIVVNRKLNAPRDEYDRLKAIVHNALRDGSIESQNRAKLPRFKDRLLGRIAHFRRLHPRRGERLLEALGPLLE